MNKLFMDAEIKIEKIFGNDSRDEIRFTDKIEKSQFFNSNYSNIKSSNKPFKPQKMNVTPFLKQFTKNENDYSSIKKDKKRNFDINKDNYYSEFIKKVNEKEKEENYKSNKIQKKKTINNQINQSKSSLNVFSLKNVNYNNNEEKKNNSEKRNSKSKKKKETGIMKKNTSNFIYFNQKTPLITINSKMKMIQNSIQLEIKSTIPEYKKLKIQKIDMPNYWIIKDEKNLNGEYKLNSKFIKDNTTETENNFKTIYNVNNKKKSYLCCI